MYEYYAKYNIFVNVLTSLEVYCKLYLPTSNIAIPGYIYKNLKRLQSTFKLSYL